MKRVSILIVCIVTVVFISGCAASKVGMGFGESYRLCRDSQILNPDARMNLKPVEVMDGEGARLSVEKYRKEFEKESPKPLFLFNVGTGSSAGGN